MYAARRRPFSGDVLLSNNLLAIYPLWDDAEDTAVK